MKEINVQECGSYQPIDLPFFDKGTLSCSEINQYTRLHLKYLLVLLSDTLGQANYVEHPDCE